MIREVSWKILRRRRSGFVVLVVVSVLMAQILVSFAQNDGISTTNQQEVLSRTDETPELASKALETLAVKGRASKTGYSRDEFSSSWATLGDCDVRNLILQRDLTDVKLGSDGCIVLSGKLSDPYTAATIDFVRGSDTSDEVQVDHVVALSDSWQKGAQATSEEQRLLLANDPLNLLAVDGDTNQQKGDSDAASWLPPNKDFRCRYVARQIAVKKKYNLWVTPAEKTAMQRVLNSCPDQPLPIEK